MVAEMRAVQADLAARAPFAEDGQAVRETRGILEDLVSPPSTLHLVQKSADSLAAASAGGFVEVG